ncbi:MAG: PadR family transcriptional regulator, partial [Vicinamibacteria bacterium]|nr:PadR family transcriptional regulator [Vicinamibacteria bacterium]
VLASLADDDKHGYAMMADIRKFAGVDLGPGTLYGAITRLEARAFIKPLAAEERRQRYRMTPLGRRHLEAQLAVMEPIVRVAARRLKLS